MIPISEAVKYPVGTRFRLESLDSEDAFYDEKENFLNKECTLVRSPRFDFGNGLTAVFFYASESTTTFTLLP